MSNETKQAFTVKTVDKKYNIVEQFPWCQSLCSSDCYTLHSAENHMKDNGYAYLTL